MKYRADIDRIRTVRDDAGMTQMDLAVAAGVGLRTVQRLERGTHAQHERVAKAISAALDVPVEECFILHDTQSDTPATAGVKSQCGPATVKKRAASTTQGA